MVDLGNNHNQKDIVIYRQGGISYKKANYRISNNF